MSTGRILTFYSYKGGVGRSMAMANVAVLLASRGKKVLVIDWDLEAPGLEKYFQPYLRGARETTPGIVDMIDAWDQGKELPWRDCLLNAQVLGKDLKLISAGRADESYPARLAGLQWSSLFAKRDLGQYLERLRDEWTAEYDYVLIDSRTGITDTGGICTIHLPDAVIMFFTANEQSVTGAVRAMRAARAAHEQLPVDRAKLVIIPVPSRDEMTSEHDKAKQWRARFADSAAEFYADWLDKDVPPSEAVKVLRIPYKAYWSFGEPLPVIDDGITEPGSIGYHMALLASLIETGFDWKAMSAGQYSIGKAAPEVPWWRRRLVALGPVVVAAGIVAAAMPKLTHCEGKPDPPRAPNPIAVKALEAARNEERDPLLRALLFREVAEIAPGDFPVQDVRYLLDARRVPTRVLRGPISAATFSPDGTRLLVIYDEGTAAIWPVEGDGDPVVLVSCEDNHRRVPDGATDPCTQASNVGLFVNGGKQVLLNVNWQLGLWPVEGGEVDWLTYAGDEVELTTWVMGAVDGSGTRALVNSPSVLAEAELTKGELRPLRHDHLSDAVGYAAGPTVIMSDGTIVPLDGATQIAPKWTDGVDLADVGPPDGWSVAVSSKERNVHAWHPKLKDPQGWRATPEVTSLAAGAFRYALGTADGTVLMRSADRPLETIDLKLPNRAMITGLAVSADDKWVLAGHDTGCDDGNATAWRIDARQPIALRGQGARVYEVGLSGNGRWAVTVATNGTARIWDLTAPPLLEGATTRDQIVARLRTIRACLTTNERYLLGEDPATAEKGWRACEPELNEIMWPLVRDVAAGAAAPR